MYFKNVMMSYTHVCWSFSQQMAFSHLVHNHTASLHFNESPSSCHVSLPFFFFGNVLGTVLASFCKQHQLESLGKKELLRYCPIRLAGGVFS